MRYIRNAPTIVSDLATFPDPKDPKKTIPFRVAFDSWLDFIFGLKAWSDGGPAVARTQLEALANIMRAFEGTRPPPVDGVRQLAEVDAEWGVRDEDHEIFCRIVCASEVVGNMAVEKARIQGFKLAVLSAATEPRAANGVVAEKKAAPSQTAC